MRSKSGTSQCQPSGVPVAALFSTEPSSLYAALRVAQSIAQARGVASPAA